MTHLLSISALTHSTRLPTARSMSVSFWPLPAGSRSGVRRCSGFDGLLPLQGF
ncbi:hypothetical protein FOFC_18301 [Fusarium oxysporum]|nr:hypothetical protein FOFC_18301 [Fusarium oxysporum]